MFFQNYQEAIVLVLMPFVAVSVAVSIVTFAFMMLIDVFDDIMHQ